MPHRSPVWHPLIKQDKFREIEEHFSFSYQNQSVSANTVFVVVGRDREVVFSMETQADMTCLLRVNTKNVGWQKTMMHVFHNIRGVYAVTIDADQGTARVTGKVDPNILLALLAKSRELIELVWIHFGNQPANNSQYLQQQQLGRNNNGYYGNNNGYYGNNNDMYLQYYGAGGGLRMNNQQQLGLYNSQYQHQHQHQHQHQYPHQHQHQHQHQYPHQHQYQRQHQQQQPYQHQHQQQSQSFQTPAKPAKPVATYKGIPPLKGKPYNGNVDCCSIM